MRWFTSFFLTTVLTVLACLLLWARDHPLLGIQEVSDVLVWLIPGPIAYFCRHFSVYLMFACWTGIRVALTWALAYTTAASEGSPREYSPLGTTLRELAFHWMMNPTRWWLATFVPLLGFMIAISGVIVFFFVPDPFVRVCWGLSALFSTSVAASFAMPDRVDPLTPTTREEAIDPLLRVPGDAEPAGTA